MNLDVIEFGLRLGPIGRKYTLATRIITLGIRACGDIVRITPEELARESCTWIKADTGKYAKREWAIIDENTKRYGEVYRIKNFEKYPTKVYLNKRALYWAANITGLTTPKKYYLYQAAFYSAPDNVCDWDHIPESHRVPLNRFAHMPIKKYYEIKGHYIYLKIPYTFMVDEFSECKL